MTIQPSHARRRRMPLTALLASLAVAAALVGNFGRVSAQDEMTSHPAHIHEGTCDNLNPKPLFPLTNVSEMGMMGGTPEAESSPMAMGDMMGVASAVMVETSVTTVDVSLEDLLGMADHAINIHESKENIENYIACGDVGGKVMTGPGMDQGGTLLVGLRELNGSGYAGIAQLEGKGDQTEVTIYLAEDLTGGSTADGADQEYATPTS
jgi:hypothetical protein